MLQTFKTLFGFAGGARCGPAVPVPPAVEVQVAPDVVKSSAVPVYPPIDGGIPMMQAGAVVASQAAMINRLRRHLALPTEEFEANYLAPIHRAAALVGLLPATKDKHFTGQGGLFRMCLEIAVFAAQAADGVMFAGHAKIERRRQVEDAWRHAAFFCGLSVELHRPLTEMLVVEPRTGATWNPFMGPLTEWARLGGHERVHVRWMDQAIQQPGAKSTAAWSLNYLVGAQILAALHAVDTSIVQTMAGVVTDSITVVDDHALAKLIRAVRRGAIERDHALKPSLYGALTQGAHMEPYFLDAMRSLVMDGAWSVNERSSRLNFGKDGCFLMWPLGAKDITRRMLERNVQGVPTQEATLADMLLNAGIIARAPDGGGLWSVRTVNDLSKEVLAVRLSNPASILAVLDVRPEPFEEVLAGGAAATKPERGVAGPAVQPIVTGPVVPKIQMFDPDSDDVTEIPSTAGAASLAAHVEAEKTDPGKPATSRERRQPTPRGASTPAQGPNVNPRGRAGALPEVEPAAQDQSSLDKQIVAALGPALAAVVATWVDDWNTSRKPTMFTRVGEGLALRMELLTKCGLDMPSIQEPLKSNGFIHLTEVGGRQRVMSKVRFGDEEDHAYILKTSFAKRCGFVLT